MNFTSSDGFDIELDKNNQNKTSLGDNKVQTISLENRLEINDVINQIKKLLESNEFDDKEDAQLEVQRVENQLKKEKLKALVIQQSLKALKDIFTGVLTEVISTPVIQSITKILDSVELGSIGLGNVG